MKLARGTTVISKSPAFCMLKYQIQSTVHRVVNRSLHTSGIAPEKTEDSLVGRSPLFHFFLLPDSKAVIRILWISRSERRLLS